MHFYALVAFPPTDEPQVKELVERLMAPYRESECRCAEQDSDAECTCDVFWDWYQIGGRWTGELSDYNPQTDPANVETCGMCGGSGIRSGGLEQFGQAWFDACGGCNGCRGIGAHVKWPTEWAEHSGDIARLGSVRAKLAASPPYRVLAGELVYAKERWNGDDFVEADNIAAELDRLSDDCTVVIVDYHS